MQYKFSKCPHCGKFIDVFKPTGWNDLKERIGNPVGFCLSCMKPYNTGRKYWKDMDGGDRFVAYTRVAFGAVFGGMLLGMFPILVLSLLNSKFNWIQSDDGYENGFFTCIILGIVLSTWGHFVELADLKKLPEPNKSNKQN
jgi:hypothetical protein